MKGDGFMKLNYTGKNIDITDALRDVSNKKFSKLDKYFDENIEGNVTFSSEKNRKIIEVTINLPGTIIRAEESTDDMYVSIDKSVDILERQIRKYKTKLQKRYKNGETIRFENVMPLTEKEKEEDEKGPRIVRKKKFILKPMMSEEAVLQMELLRHNFFVFYNAETEQVNVVYKRKGNTYGLIEPEF